MEMLGGFSDLPWTDQQGNRGQGMGVGVGEGWVGFRTVLRGTKTASGVSLQELMMQHL